MDGKRLNHDTKLREGKEIFLSVTQTLNCLANNTTLWKLKSLSHVQLFATPGTIQYMVILQGTILKWVAFPSPGNLSNPGIEPRSPTLQADSLPAEPPGKPNTALSNSKSMPLISIKTKQSNKRRDTRYNK